ncbi:MAG: hypothetical protein DRI57_32585 [Deltaproteobacteria bacterium]|nr:MAG: hypothetical protein DRI57_32585 [Deltaproteobacteria bacterium]
MMNDFSYSLLRLIVVGDGDTDYLFLEKAVRDDPDLSALPISVMRPEDVGLKRRVGGGHKTLLKEAGLVSIKAAQGFAEAVLVLVDNDGDERFRFPHKKHCGNCRECEASDALEKVEWGQPFRKGAAILFQAVETLLLSAKQDVGFTPQLEESLYSLPLKIKLYGRQIHDAAEMYDAFREVLENTDVNRIRARSYPRMKKILTEMMS